VKYSLEVKGLEEVEVAIDDAIEEVRRQARGKLFKVAKRVERDAKKEAPVDVGLLRAKIVAEEEIAPGITKWKIGVFDEEVCRYAYYVEMGTRPRDPKNPRTWPPIGPLIEWARRHHMDERAAYAIRRAIIKRGTRPQPYLRPAMQGADRELENELRQI